MFLCWSAKGGSGTTVVAAALALVLARQQPTTLVDLAGDIPAALGLPQPSGPGVADWLASPTADLGGQTLFAGVYTGGALQVTGTLTLDAQGDAGAVFIFQAASSLTTASGSSVSLINGAGACNVFWQVTSSATLGTGSRMVGTVMALTSIWAGTNASIQGRLLARNGEVTLDSNTFSRATCAQVVETTTTTTTTTTGGGSGGPATTTTTGGGSGGPATTTGGAATTVRTLPGTGSTTDGGFLAALVLIAIGSGMAVIARRSPRGSLR